MKFDVIILGGGPAGLAAAILLSKAGVLTALIEKKTYPREKTCAGILTQKTISILENYFPTFDLGQFTSTNQVFLMYKGENITNFTVKHPFTLVERNMFDYALLNMCRKAGVFIMDNTTVVNFSPDQNTLFLNNDLSMTYRCLVAADGVYSPTRKHLNLQEIPVGFCIQDSFDRYTCANSLVHLQELHLDFGSLFLGYSWVVPNSKRIIVGTGMLIEDFDWPSMLAKHNEICTKIGLSGSTKRRGAYIPIGGAVDQTEHPYENIILIGDAAGLVNPLTGEGIYTALLSGLLAYRAYEMNSPWFRTTYLSLLMPTVKSLTEQVTLLPEFYNNFLLENLIFQFKDCPEYLASICDDVISLEKQSYQSLLIELQGLFR